MPFSFNIGIEELRYVLRYIQSLKRAEPISTQDKLCEILPDIMNSTDPRIIGEKLGLVLQQGIISQGTMPRKDFDKFACSIIQQLTLSFRDVHDIWKAGLIKYFLPNLKEIWVACEPPLDLISTENGAYYLLKTQLRIVERLIYFQSTGDYVTKIKKMLSRDGFDQSNIEKIKFVQLSSPYIPPVVLYITEDEVKGVQGKFPPPIVQGQENDYYLRNELSSDWMIELDEINALKYKADLFKNIKEKEYKQWN